MEPNQVYPDLDPQDKAMILKNFDEIVTPTEEELSYEFTKEELIKLCENIKCSVRMERWNPIFDFTCQLKRRGRLENRPPDKVLKLLKKLGNKYKTCPRRSFTQEQIDKDRESYWRLTKSWNVRWLKFIQETTAQYSETCEHHDEIQPPNNPHQNQDSEMSVAIVENDGIERTLQPSNNPPSYMVNLHYQFSELAGNAEGVLNTKKYFPPTKNQQNSKNVRESSLDRLADVVDEVISQSLPLSLALGSESLVVQSEEYENFHSQIPVTSTQSQEIAK